ncbi:TPA: hypothetical protein ACIZCU_000904 [Legionella pneumophila]|nr:hypothetical protein [Legionella pneumophila]
MVWNSYALVCIRLSIEFPGDEQQALFTLQKQTGIDKSKITQTAAQAANNTNPVKGIIESEYDVDSEKKVTKVGEIRRFFIPGLIQKDYLNINLIFIT